MVALAGQGQAPPLRRKLMLTQHLAALTFRDNERALTRTEITITLVLHLAGLLAAAYLIQIPLWIAPVALAGLCVLPLLRYRSRGTFAIETLAPLFFLYVIIAARFAYIRVFGGDVPGYFDYNLPDWQSTFFRLEPWAICAFGYSIAIQIRYLAGHDWSSKRLTIARLTLDVIALGWAGSLLFLDLPISGVTGTDPYAYTQMGIDLATRGTPLHRFTLFPSVASLNIAWSPIVHTGYHIPINADGDAPSVWPPGGSLAFAIAYRVRGEGGLYGVNSWVCLLLLLATGALAEQLFTDTNERMWIAAISTVLLTTSHTLFDWAPVPMVDSQAALFSVLAIGLSWAAAKQQNNPRRTLLYAMLAGLALGAAYDVRHTQVLIAPAIFVLLWANELPNALRLRALVIAGAASLVVALPDLWYHQTVFGSWLTPESTELSLFSLASVDSTLNRLATDLLAAREFGWLLPFAIYGAYRLARAKRIEFIALALWGGVLVGFHLLYPALRPRDLLPEFVPLVIVIAYGIVEFIAMLWRGQSQWQSWVAPIGLLLTAWLMLIRVWNVVPLAWNHSQRPFGSLTVEQRVALRQIERLTPPRAVVGSVLNDGAIDLYARRETFIPTMWSAQEQDAFFAVMFREGRAVYLLDDSAGMTTVRHQLEARYTLTQVAVLDVPLSSVLPGDTSSALWEILKTDDR